ncbi:substrate-binding domain-containing protein [Primorskyibacter sp. S187A]|uniref:substrate-binding domain-containing protein n=1 Tax=Primorskyibacter sp. S187A TaxID=3415130 RepID=UPI003C7C436D
MNLKELSAQLGLSQTTVSRALNGYPEVSEATRKRVTEAARAAKYTPSNRARSLATGRSMAIGHVIPVSSKHEMVNPVFGDFIAGAGEVYSAAGYEMILRMVPDSDQEDVYREFSAKGNVDGIVVHGPRPEDPRIGLLQELGLPFVVHGRSSSTKVDYSWLDVPNRRAFFDGTQHLIDLGHLRIGLINGAEELDFAIRRRQGFEDALNQADLPVNPRWMRSSDMTEHYGYEAARELIAMEHAPTGLIVASIITALGVQRAIRECGLEMGRDISVLIFDDELSYLRNGSEDAAIFTAMRSSVRRAGSLLANMLLQKIAEPMAPVKTHMMEDITFVKGPSTGPAPE